MLKAKPAAVDSLVLRTLDPHVEVQKAGDPNPRGCCNHLLMDVLQAEQSRKTVPAAKPMSLL
jgi:hypothetical protein